MKLKKSKKGFTLTEMIACCAILVVLSGAVVALLVSGEKLFSNGYDAADSSIDINLFQSLVLRDLPSADGVEEKSVDDVKNNPIGAAFFFNENGEFVFRTAGKDNVFKNVTEARISFSAAGDNENARVFMSFSLSLANGSSHTGGITMNNFSVKESLTGDFSLSPGGSASEGFTSVEAIYFKNNVS